MGKARGENALPQARCRSAKVLDPNIALSFAAHLAGNPSAALAFTAFIHSYIYTYVWDYVWSGRIQAISVRSNIGARTDWNCIPFWQGISVGITLQLHPSSYRCM